MILVSACLLGHKTKYNGGSNDHELLLKYAAQGKFITACPECLGGLPIPHPPSEIIGGGGREVLEGQTAVVSKNGGAMTRFFIDGANRTLALAQKYQVRAAILKERSPSCGVRQIYNGSFAGIRIEGQGVAASLLKQHGIAVYSEEDLSEELLIRLMAETNSLSS